MKPAPDATHAATAIKWIVDARHSPVSLIDFLKRLRSIIDAVRAAAAKDDSSHSGDVDVPDAIDEAHNVTLRQRKVYHRFTTHQPSHALSHRTLNTSSFSLPRRTTATRRASLHFSNCSTISDLPVLFRPIERSLKPSWFAG